MDSSHTCFNLNHTFSSSHTMHKLPSILIMCWDYLNILFWQKQPNTPSIVHILLHILDLLLLLKLQQLLLAAWRWSPCPPSSPSCPPPTTWLCWAWCLHQWWQDCWWLMITKNTIVKRWPLAMVNETKMTNMIKVTRKTTMNKRTTTAMTEKTTMTKWTTVIKRSPPPPSAPDPPGAAFWCAPSSCSSSPPWSPPSPGTGWPPPRMKDLNC